MASPGLTLIRQALADLRAPAYPVTGQCAPDPAAPYPLNMGVVTRGLRVDHSGVVVIGGPGSADYHNPVSVSLYALDQHASITQAGDGSASLAAFLAQSRYLRRSQDPEGGWRYPVPVPRYRVTPGWYSAMAQGLAASVLLRALELTGEKSYQDAADGAVRLLLSPVNAGGCSHYDPLGRPFLEECPADPPCHILNGAVFALIGLAEHDACHCGRHTSPAAAQRLADSLPDFDLGYWSRYDLRFRVPATLPYHSLHISLLEVAGQFFPGHGFEKAAVRWAALRRRPYCRLRAAAGKASFILREEQGLLRGGRQPLERYPRAQRARGRQSRKQQSGG